MQVDRSWRFFFFQTSLVYFTPFFKYRDEYIIDMNEVIKR